MRTREGEGGRGREVVKERNGQARTESVDAGSKRWKDGEKKAEGKRRDKDGEAINDGGGRRGG